MNAKRKISLPSLGGVEVPKEQIRDFSSGADVTLNTMRTADFQAHRKVSQAPVEPPVEPQRAFGEEPERKRRGGRRSRGAKAISLRFTPTDMAIVQNLASRAIATGEDPLKINNTTIIRAALRVARDTPPEILLAAMEEARAD